MTWAPKIRFTLELLTAIVAIVFLVASLISPDVIAHARPVLRPGAAN
jgi:hypothetical protein